VADARKVIVGRTGDQAEAKHPQHPHELARVAPEVHYGRADFVVGNRARQKGE
jgi:hypothetical protein